MPNLYTFMHSPVFSSGTSHYIALTWTPNMTGSPLYTRIYRGTVTGGPYVLLEQLPIGWTNYNDYAVTQGVKYFYVFTEWDGATESAQSAEFSGVVQVG